MDVKLILALAKSGVSDAEIERLAGLMDGAPDDPAVAPQPVQAVPAAQPADPAPAPQPVPAPAPAPRPADPAGLETLLHEVLDSVQGLRDTVQASQVLTGYQGQPTQADQLRTATQHAAGFFYPPADK